jgi:hypothetical protein
MPKVITSRRRDSEYEKALEYIKTHILFPSGLLGLIFMVAGMAALTYQFIAVSYGWTTFLESIGLFMAGLLLGWGQTRYHQFLLKEHPGYFAGRMRLYSRTSQRRARKQLQRSDLAHAGRNWMPLAYLAGIALLVGTSSWVSVAGETYFLAAFLLPWAGFFWAKMFFWRGILGKGKGKTP